MSYSQNPHHYNDSAFNSHSHTLDNRTTANAVPASIISGTYINSNIIVHQKHVDSTMGAKSSYSGRSQSTKKTSQSTKRPSTIHEEKKIIPADVNKTVISASGGHMRTGSYDMNGVNHVNSNHFHNNSFVSGMSSASKKKSTTNPSNKGLIA